MISLVIVLIYADFRCDLYDLHKELVPYAEAWSWQKSIVKERKELSERNEDFSDSLIILQHNPVYTLGAGSSESFLNFDVSDAPFDLYRTERGGEVTYHGPGQVIILPLFFEKNKIKFTYCLVIHVCLDFWVFL